jgi:glycosyltransferase involved in cell wall biosynthesis
MTRLRIGFVVPRYGEQVLGGAETLARVLAERLAAAGLADPLVLTTCAQDHITWENKLPPGETSINGVPVIRFPVGWQGSDLTRYHALHLRLIRGELLPPTEQYEWVDQSPHSPQLYAYIERFGRNFDFLFFIPYLFGTTLYGSAIYPERSILWPCLHNESYAYLQPMRDMYHACLGVMFNSYPEMRLAHRLYGKHPGSQIVGFGFSPLDADGARFQEQSNLRAPFILYSGRLEGAKNVPLLVRCFLEYKQHHRTPLKLALMGQGPETIPQRSDIVRLGFMQGQEKLNTYAGATVLCQPSVNESFSIVMMEAWLSGVPVLVHADCEVTRYHVTRCNGGLYFRDYNDFEGVMDLLLSDEQLRRRLGANGKQYVQTQYNWDAVLRRFEESIAKWNAAKSE